MSEFVELTQKFTSAVENQDGAALAALFTSDGIYDDAFYAEFTGHEAISAMLHDLWYRDGEDFRWQMFDQVSNRKIGYARYNFSYKSKHARAAGERILSQGTAQFYLNGDKITLYREHWEGTAMLSMLKLPGDQLEKVAKKQADVLKAKPEMSSHLK
jgi:hypothetical protein